MPVIKLKCNRCEATTNAPSIRPGDFCPACQEGVLQPVDPVVFEHYQEFMDRLIGLKPPATKTTTVTVQAGVKPDGTDVLMIGNHAYHRTPFTAGWQPYRLDGTEVFNVIRGF